MKILTRNGEITLSPTELAKYDKDALRQLAKAKRSKTIRVDENIVRLKLRVRGTLPDELQTLLRHLANIRKHGKAYAPDECVGSFAEVHHRIAISREFVLGVQFDLDTGEMSVDFRP